MGETSYRNRSGETITWKLKHIIVDLLPDGVPVPLDDLDHSALDTHQLAALNVARIVSCGAHRRLPDLAVRIGALPLRGMPRVVGTMIKARLAVEVLLPRSNRRGTAP